MVCGGRDAECRGGHRRDGVMTHVLPSEDVGNDLRPAAPTIKDREALTGVLDDTDDFPRMGPSHGMTTPM
jgi:hypothetical protein